MKKNYTLLVLLFTMSLSFGQAPSILWSYSLPDKMGRTASPAVASDGTVYIGCSYTTRTTLPVGTTPPNFFAIKNGLKMWEQSLTESNGTKVDDILSSASIHPDGSIYTGGFFGRIVFKLDKTTGAIVSNLPIGSRQRYTAPIYSSDGNTVYVCGYNNNDKGVRSLSSDLTTQNWVFKPNDLAVDFNCTPAVSTDGTIYAASGNAAGDNKLFAINPDGTQKWASTSLVNFVSSAIAIGTDGTIYLSAKLNAVVSPTLPNGCLKAFNPIDGSEKWSVTFTDSNAEQGGPAIADNGTIYLGSIGGRMRAFNPANGTELWQYPLASNPPIGQIEVVPAIDNNGKIYFGTTGTTGGGMFYVLNSDGTEAYTPLSLGTSITSSAAIGSDGKIYVAATDSGVGKLYALQTNATGLASGGWPMYAGNEKHVGNISIITLSTDVNSIDGLSIYPNPAQNGEFYVSTTNNETKSVKIFDVLGKQVYSKRIEGNEKIKTSNLDSGIYILKVEENGKVATRKMIIN
jgi:outer membrane protein assembly factor BamB